MALIPCPECKKQISETAENCPKCGYELTPEKVAEVKEKQNITQIGCAIALLVVCLPLMVTIFTCPQKSPTPRQTYRSRQKQTPPAWQQKLWQETPGYDADTGTPHYKQKYREAHRAYETAKSNYDQNPSVSNKQVWDDAATKLDHAYLHLERSMNAGSHNMAKQRELEAFTESVKRSQK